MGKRLSGGQLAGGNSSTEKADYDFYTTNPQSVKLFLDKYIKDGENLIGSIYECSCGVGNISEVIKEYYPNNELFSSDLIERGYGYGGIDFLNYEYKRNFDTIITNPPFSLINDFIKKGLELTNRYLIYFAKAQILEGEDRINFLENTPLKYVYFNRKRQATWKNNEPLDPDGKKWATTMMMCWFVWDKEYEGEPIIRFI